MLFLYLYFNRSWLLHAGGRIIAFQNTLPSLAPGKLKKREDNAILGTPKEKTLFVPQDDYYTKFAKSCVEVGNKH